MKRDLASDFVAGEFGYMQGHSFASNLKASLNTAQNLGLSPGEIFAISMQNLISLAAHLALDLLDREAFLVACGKVYDEAQSKGVEHKEH